ncbi:hypothetical protein CTEN210_02992 [Chaetoceros tenuissimus]|uniref:Fe2OG dioxygenase domain-containing protein n=1 Tax=Chaetoceros tenuissimus TaxID=426638 RepID=A0AAD3H1C8_9STRA|nr:hypothetical protein CTEN210_02992 [Chaetoceros tenuissimus]
MIPTVRLNLSQSSFNARDVELLRNACKSYGFFYLHVQDDELKRLLPRVFEQSEKFFALPIEIKKKFSDGIMNRGYTAMEEETLDTEKQSKGDTKEGYYIAEDVSKDDARYNPAKLSGPNVYPTNLPEENLDCIEWKRTMDLYHSKMKQVGNSLARLIALALDLEESYFDEYFQNPLAVLRLLHYSDEKSDIDNGVYGCGAHSDYGFVTLLATDDNPGLQIYLNDEWIDVAPIGYANSTFVVNLGDMLERWTNGLFKSTLHRVIIKTNETDDLNSKRRRDRYSIPFFYEPDFDTLVECISTCEGKGGAKYSPIKSGEYLLNKYHQTHSDFNS